jgi:hypothetical protein
MNHDHPIVLRLTQEMFIRLTENRRMTGVPVSEYIRRAINLTLFADCQSANRNADKREPVQYALKRETR